MQSSAHIDPSLHSRAGISGSIPLSEVPTFRLIDGQLRKVKKLIKGQLTVPAKSGAIYQLLEYVNSRSGKMIRPGLVLLAGNAVGKITDEHIHIAAIFEMIHNATLLHDDVIDDGQRRRGQPTINSLWGNESAVLLGDFLLSRVLNMCTKLEPRVAKEIAATASRVCEGELRQVMNSSCVMRDAYCQKQTHHELDKVGTQYAIRNTQYDLSEAQYIDIITEKSASLFSSCCFLGGLLAQGIETQLQSLGRFGLNAGIAFQITDDLLDIIGDESKTGKTLGSDVDKSKLTLALIHLLKTIDKREKSEIIEKLNAKRYTLNANLIEMLISYGSLEYAHSRAQEFVTKATQALTGLKDSDAKDALIETAKFMANRTI